MASHNCGDVEALLASSTSAGAIVEVSRKSRKSRKSKMSCRKLLWAGVIGSVTLVAAGLVSVSGFVPKKGSNGLLLPSGMSESSSISDGQFSLKATEATCEEPYGFLPCSTSLGGNIFLMAAYGYLLLTAAQLISEGSELLLQVLNPGLIGGLVLPVLGAFPDALLIVVSGLGGSAEEAQEEVLVGMGVLAGSTIMILTLAWGGSLIFGRCDLTGPNGTAKDRTLTSKFSLFGSGVTTDEQTRWGAWIMILSIIPLIVLQIPLMFGTESTDGHLAALVGLALSFLGLVAYCTYQVFVPSLQERKMENARLHVLKTMALSKIHNQALETGDGLQNEDGSPNFETIDRIFDQFDSDNSGVLEASEIRGFLTGLELSHGDLFADEEGSDAKALHENFLKEFDLDSNGLVKRDEFKTGMCKWLQSTAKHKKEGHHHRRASLDGLANDAITELALMTVEEEEEEEEEGEPEPLTPAQVYQKASLLMASGALIVAVFADPMVDAISNFSTASGIPAFFVAFVVTPIASNASELVSSLLFAMKKKKRTISLTYSQVYGAITMNNTLCLGVFLAVVYFRGLVWEFSSEVTVIVLTTLVVGVVGGTSVTFKLVSAIPILLFYPLTIGIVAFLDYYLGWQ